MQEIRLYMTKMEALMFKRNLKRI